MSDPTRETYSFGVSYTQTFHSQESVTVYKDELFSWLGEAYDYEPTQDDIIEFLAASGQKSISEQVCGYDVPGFHIEEILFD